MSSLTNVCNNTYYVCLISIQQATTNKDINIYTVFSSHSLKENTLNQIPAYSSVQIDKNFDTFSLLLFPLIYYDVTCVILCRELWIFNKTGQILHINVYHFPGKTLLLLAVLDIKLCGFWWLVVTENKTRIF